MDLEAIHRAMYPYAERYGVIREFPEEGMDREAILAQLREMSAEEDSKWEGGKVSGSIYHGEHEHYDFLNECFGYFNHTNALQRDMCPSMSRFESEIIAMTLDMLNADAVTQRDPEPDALRHARVRRHREHHERGAGLPEHRPGARGGAPADDLAGDRAPGVHQGRPPLRPRRRRRAGRPGHDDGRHRLRRATTSSPRPRC